MDLENRPAGSFTITRAEHWLGLVVIVERREPQTMTGVLPLIATSASEILVGDDWFDVMPDGFIVWFTG